MKKTVLKLDFHDYKMKQKAMTLVSSFSGVESISVDMKDNKLTVTGDIDPVKVVGKLRKHCCYTEIVSVGPAKEPEKKKEEPKKEEPKKTEEKKKGPKDEVFYYQTYYHPHPQMVAYLHQHRSVEEDPTACVIC